MTDETSEWAELRNAVRQRVSGLTAVEVDTEAHAEELIDSLEDEAAPRPTARLDLVCDGETIEETLRQARNAVEGWEPNEGVLFLLDRTSRTDTEDPESPQVEFWRRMNLQREAWGNLDCHTVFFLKPGNYGLLLTSADDLADWFSLRFHLLGKPALGGKPGQREMTQHQDAAVPGLLSPDAARQQIETLEPALANAADSEPPEVLARRYYLPLMEASLSLGDLRHARNLRERADESTLRKADLPRWWLLNAILDTELHNLTAAQRSAEKLLEYARDEGDAETESSACHQLGMIAQKQRDFQVAEKWYRKALEIDERQGNEHGAAITYGQLGNLALEQRDFQAAENWYRKSLGVQEKQGNEHGAAQTYHQLGMIAQERRDFQVAEEWYRKALSIFEQVRADPHAARTCAQMGVLNRKRQQYEESGQWFVRAISGFASSNDDHMARTAAADFLQTCKEAPEKLQPKLRQMWEEADLGEFPEELLEEEE